MNSRLLVVWELRCIAATIDVAIKLSSFSGPPQVFDFQPHASFVSHEWPRRDSLCHTFRLPIRDTVSAPCGKPVQRQAGSNHCCCFLCHPRLVFPLRFLRLDVALSPFLDGCCLNLRRSIWTYEHWKGPPGPSASRFCTGSAAGMAHDAEVWVEPGELAPNSHGGRWRSSKYARAARQLC